MLIKSDLLLKLLRKFARHSCTRMNSVDSSEKLVQLETIGKVFLIGINRPAKRNCVNTPTATQLWDAVKFFENNNDLRVAVLHGIGGNFCAGFDLSELSSMAQHGSKLPEKADMPEGWGPMGPSRGFISKPVIAAVTGYAVAGGLELSLLCDMRIAESNAIFGVFCRRFGVPLVDGGTVRLPQLIGLSRALDMILTGRPVPAQEAYEMGLANKVVPTGAALGEAVKIAQTIANFPQECMLRDRLSAYQSCFDAESLKEALDFEMKNARHVIEQESVAGAQSFVDGVGRSGKFTKWDKSKL